MADIYIAKNDLSQAEDAYTKGAAAGDTAAYYRLGKLHEQMGKNTEAEKDFKQAAAIGENRAYYSLGNLYKGRGNNSLAEEDFEKSVSAGNKDAFLPLGDAQSAPGKFSVAYNNYENALSHGNHKAYLRIAEMYRKGEGRPVDNVQALTYLFKARKLGVSGLDIKIAHLEKKLQPEGLAKAYDLAKGNVNDFSTETP